MPFRLLLSPVSPSHLGPFSITISRSCCSKYLEITVHDASIRSRIIDVSIRHKSFLQSVGGTELPVSQKLSSVLQILRWRMRALQSPTQLEWDSVLRSGLVLTHAAISANHKLHLSDLRPDHREFAAIRLNHQASSLRKLSDRTSELLFDFSLYTNLPHLPKPSLTTHDVQYRIIRIEAGIPPDLQKHIISLPATGVTDTQGGDSLAPDSSSITAMLRHRE